MKKSFLALILMASVSAALAQTDLELMKALKDEGYSQKEIDEVMAERYANPENKDEDNSLSRAPSKDIHHKSAPKKAPAKKASQK